MEMKGTGLFVKALQSEGVDKIFAYPGGYVVDLFDELYKQDKIELILPRHEQGLIHAADGYARATGKVGVCLVTSGPGATNLVTGIATANYDSVPLVCFTGQVPTHLIGNDAFQEVDIVGMTRNICKYCITVRERKDLGRIIREAFYIAATGKPGPVIIDLPKDIMLEMGDGTYPSEVHIRGYKPNTGVHTGQIKKALELLDIAKKPLFLIGGGVHISSAEAAMTQLTEQTHIPVVTTLMGKGAIPTAHPNYFGNIGMHGNYAANKAIGECDVLFSIGTRFNDRITGKIKEFASNAKIIHVDIEAASISRNITVDIPIVADARLAIENLLNRVKGYDTEVWMEQMETWRKEEEKEDTCNQGLTPKSILQEISRKFQDAIIVTDVGQNQMWTMQYLEMNLNTKLLTSGGFGTMGYGFPAAIGAKLGMMEKQVICITGDGGFQMNLQELATAVTQELPMIICIFNNGYLGMVRQLQQLFYDRRYSGTCLRHRKSCQSNCADNTKECPPYSPDFMKLADSYGAYGIRVFTEEEVEPAFKQALLNQGAPTIIEFMIESSELVFPMVKSGSPLSDMIMGID